MTGEPFPLGMQAALFASLLLHVLSLGAQEGKKVTLPARTKITIVEFSDFQCPFCARQAPDLRKLQLEYPAAVDIVFKNFPLSFHSQARAAHLAALAAKQQAKFWGMHDLIFSHPGHLSANDLDGYADQLGLDKNRFHRDMESAAEAAAIDHDLAEGAGSGVSGTPSFLIDGKVLVGVQSYPVLKGIVEAELNGKEWPRIAASKVTPITVDTTGAPARGPESAAVTIVEFSDFQCPFCAKALLSLQQTVAANSGAVRWVFKNFPLDFHQDSHLAHMAALAAGEQGKFWQMHDLIFTHQSTIKRNDLLRFASQLQLDQARFERDLDSPVLNARIEADEKEAARIGISGTPTYVIDGEMVSGLSAQSLQTLIREKLAKQVLPARMTPASGIPALDLALGPEDAPIRVEWYVDLASPLTPRSAVELQQFLSAHPGQVRVQFRNFPLPHREESLLLHRFALAAAAQGKFWTMESLLLADTQPKNRTELKRLAAQARLDQNRLWTEVDSQVYDPIILRDLTKAQDRGVVGTPTFVVGERKFEGVNVLQQLGKK